MKQKQNQINFNDEKHLKSILKHAKKQMSGDVGIAQKVVAKIAKNPKSIIPFVIVLIYFAIVGVVTNVSWIVKLVQWTF